MLSIFGQAFAVRSGQDIVVQYQIDETVLFRNPSVREAIAQTGFFQTLQGDTEVLAIPTKKSGVLIVEPSRSMPLAKNITLASL